MAPRDRFPSLPLTVEDAAALDGWSAELELAAAQLRGFTSLHHELLQQYLALGQAVNRARAGIDAAARSAAGKAPSTGTFVVRSWPNGDQIRATLSTQRKVDAALVLSRYPSAVEIPGLVSVSVTGLESAVLARTLPQSVLDGVSITGTSVSLKYVAGGES
jgi:hypothetical protein